VLEWWFGKAIRLGAHLVIGKLDVHDGTEIA